MSEEEKYGEQKGAADTGMSETGALKAGMSEAAPAENSCEEAGAACLLRAEKFLSEENYDEAIPLLLEAAEQGNMRAQFRLGMCYYKGNGVQRSYRRA